MLGFAAYNKKRMVFMDTIINDLVAILKGDTDTISKEKQLDSYIQETVKTIVGEAFERYDDSLIPAMKEKGYPKTEARCQVHRTNSTIKNKGNYLTKIMVEYFYRKIIDTYLFSH
jgi:hypothetical protein